MSHATINLDFLKNEPADEYHAKAEFYLSSHQLHDFMRCPYLHAKKRAGLIFDKVNRPGAHPGGHISDSGRATG